MKALLCIFILVSVSNYSLYSQNRTIKGRVISDELRTLRGIPIVIDDSLVVGKTDSIGFFQIFIPASVDKLTFKDVGLEETVIKFVSKCDYVEVVILLRDTYDFLSLKRIDRLRKKKFKMLPELHKKAFAKGLFKTDNVCYAQEFIPHYKKQK